VLTDANLYQYVEQQSCK